MKERHYLGMICQNNLLNRKLQDQNFHFRFILLPPEKNIKKRNHRFSQRSGDLENGNSPEVSLICAVTLCCHLLQARKGINLPVSGQQSEQIHF